MATRHELYAKFGETAEAGQLLETELVNSILALEALENGWVEVNNPPEATNVLRELDSMTLGRLMGRLKFHLKVEEDHLSFLLGSLAARNKLNHGFFERHNFKIQTPEGRDEMIRDLEQLHDTLFRAWQNASLLSQVLFSAVQLLTDPDKNNPEQPITDPGNF